MKTARKSTASLPLLLCATKRPNLGPSLILSSVGIRGPAR